MNASSALASDYRCDRCNKYFAEAQLKQIRAGSGSVLACPVCGDLARKEVSRAARSLPALMASAFLYPFRGSTLMWTLGLVVVMTGLQFIPFFGGLIAASAEVGLLFAVLKSSAAGRTELSVEAGDLSDRSMWLMPLFKFVSAVLVSFGPAVAIAFLLGRAGNDPSMLPVIYGAMGLGLLYFPAALVVAAHSDGCLGAFNPIAGFSFIAQIPGPYFITVGFVFAAAAAGAGMNTVAAAVNVPVVGYVVRSFAALYAPLVAMRMLGLLMEEHAEEL